MVLNRSLTIEGGNAMDVNVLEDLLEERRFTELKAILEGIQEADVAEFIDEVDNPKSSLLIFRLLQKEMASDVFSFLSTEKQAELCTLVNDEELDDLIDELFFDDMIDLIEEVPANVVKKILKDATETERRLINQFLNYPEDSAGSLMTIEFVDLKKEMTVAEAIERIRKIGVEKETIYTCYVIDHKRILEGLVSLRDLVLANPDEILNNIMETDIIFAHTGDDQEEIADTMKKYDFLSMPVVDKEQRLVGIITIDDVVDVIQEENEEDFQRMAALEPDEEEYLDASTFKLAKRRIVWLAILMVSATFTQIINEAYIDVTAAITDLVVFMTMLTGTSGNVGAQSSTLVIRSLTLGEVDFSDLFRVFMKELRVSFVVAVPLALMNYIRIFFFGSYAGNLSIAMTVNFTMIFTIIFAALVGGMLPIVAKKCRLDPALMASPLITTIVDACSLLIYFNIASFIYGL